MREELAQAGFTQLMSPEQVDQALGRAGTTLLVVNSVCGCAAAGARPGVIQALRRKGLRFDHLVTVFAGMESEATQRARQYFEGAAPVRPRRPSSGTAGWCTSWVATPSWSAPPRPSPTNWPRPRKWRASPPRSLTK